MHNHKLSFIVLPLWTLIAASLLAVVEAYTAVLSYPLVASLNLVIIYLGWGLPCLSDHLSSARMWFVTLGLGLVLAIVYYLSQVYMPGLGTTLPFVVSAYLVIAWQQSNQRLWQPLQMLVGSAIVALVGWFVVLLIAYLLSPIFPFYASQLFEPAVSYPVSGVMLGVGLALIRAFPMKLSHLQDVVFTFCQLLLLVVSAFVVIVIVMGFVHPQTTLDPSLINLTEIILLIFLNGALSNQLQLAYFSVVNKIVTLIIWLSNLLPLMAIYAIIQRFQNPQDYVLAVDGYLALLYSLVILAYSIFYSVLLVKPNRAYFKCGHCYLTVAIVILTIVVNGFVLSAV